MNVVIFSNRFLLFLLGETQGQGKKRQNFGGQNFLFAFQNTADNFTKSFSHLVVSTVSDWVTQTSERLELPLKCKNLQLTFFYLNMIHHQRLQNAMLKKAHKKVLKLNKPDNEMRNMTLFLRQASLSRSEERHTLTTQFLRLDHFEAAEAARLRHSSR